MTVHAFDPSLLPDAARRMWMEVDDIALTPEAANRALQAIDDFSLQVPQRTVGMLQADAALGDTSDASKSAGNSEPIPAWMQVDEGKMSAAVERAHERVAAEIACSDTVLGELESKKLKLLASDDGTPRQPADLEPHQQQALEATEGELWSERGVRQQLGTAGRLLSALRGHHSGDDFGFILQGTIGQAFTPAFLASTGPLSTVFVGVSHLRAYGARDPETGNRSKMAASGAIGVGSFAMIRYLMGQKRPGYGIMPPFSMSFNDPIMGVGVGISFPGMFFFDFFRRPNGDGGVEAGLSFLAPPIPNPAIAISHHDWGKPMEKAMVAIAHGAKAVGGKLAGAYATVKHAIGDGEEAWPVPNYSSYSELLKSRTGNDVHDVAPGASISPEPGVVYRAQGRNFAFSKAFVEKLGAAATIDFGAMEITRPWAVHPGSGAVLGPSTAVLVDDIWFEPRSRAKLQIPPDLDGGPDTVHTFDLQSISLQEEFDRIERDLPRDAYVVSIEGVPRSEHGRTLEWVKREVEPPVSAAAQQTQAS